MPKTKKEALLHKKHLSTKLLVPGSKEYLAAQAAEEGGEGDDGIGGGGVVTYTSLEALPVGEATKTALSSLPYNAKEEVTTLIGLMSFAQAKNRRASLDKQLSKRRVPCRQANDSLKVRLQLFAASLEE